MIKDVEGYKSCQHLFYFIGNEKFPIKQKRPARVIRYVYSDRSPYHFLMRYSVVSHLVLCVTDQSHAVCSLPPQLLRNPDNH